MQFLKLITKLAAFFGNHYRSPMLKMTIAIDRRWRIDFGSSGWQSEIAKLDPVFELLKAYKEACERIEILSRHTDGYYNHPESEPEPLPADAMSIQVGPRVLFAFNNASLHTPFAHMPITAIGPLSRAVVMVRRLRKALEHHGPTSTASQPITIKLSQN